MGFVSILLAILAFGLMIIIHELGHFVSAKLCEIQVNEFAFGMGPVIFRFQKGETAYVIRLLPFGGSVSMEGENDSGADDTTHRSEDGVLVTSEGESAGYNPRAFNRKPVWQRMIVILAGAFMNLILGYFVVMLSLGTSEAIASTTILGFHENSVSSSQLKPGDRITNIDGLPIFTSSDIIYKIQNSTEKNAEGNQIYDITVKRDGQDVLLENVEFGYIEQKNGTTSIYFDFYVERVEKNFINLVTESFMETLSTGRLILITFMDLIGGRYGINDLSGPVGVVTVVAQSAAIDISYFFSIVSLITINLGIMNLIPFPALDGCRFLFLLIEAIRRKPLRQDIEPYIHFAGFALLMLLMVIVTFNDIVRLVTGGFGGA